MIIGVTVRKPRSRAPTWPGFLRGRDENNHRTILDCSSLLRRIQKPGMGLYFSFNPNGTVLFLRGHAGDGGAHQKEIQMTTHLDQLLASTCEHTACEALAQAEKIAEGVGG